MNTSQEWLETDGLGGFASGTTNGIRTRRYHALLLTATTPPTGRVALVNGFEAWIETPRGKFALTSQRYAPDVVHPDGASCMNNFSIEPWPTWQFKFEDGTELTQEIFIARESAVTALNWKLTREQKNVRLFVRPLVSGRDYHSLHHENAAFNFTPTPNGEKVLFRPYDGVPAFYAMYSSNGHYVHEPLWYRNFLYTEERERGLDDTEDLASPGVFEWDLSAGDAIWLLTTADSPALSRKRDLSVRRFYECLRENEKLRRAEFSSRLHRAADDYIVQRGYARESVANQGESSRVLTNATTGKTIVAGYPWFTDWGRDTFIALRGLCLATGRLEDARDILIAWANSVSEGMLPNLFPDQGAKPEYNSVDASLWYIIAVHEYLEACSSRRQEAHSSQSEIGNRQSKISQSLLTSAATSDEAVFQKAILAILDGYSKGTRFGIRMDTDGLLAAGERGVQLTWMDAKVGEWVVTPRAGKPVEVQALWLNALKIASQFEPKWEAVFERGLKSFRDKFWNKNAGCLNDVIDVNHRAGEVDASFRPNQIFAVGGLPFPLLDGARAERIVSLVEEKLWTPLGLRSLAQGEKAYAPHYSGGVLQRDGAYHQGTVWPWLIGPFVEAWVRVRGNSNEAKRAAREKFLSPILAHLNSAGLGHISEIADATAPYTPRGCPFQAWSVGEALRLDQVVLREQTGARASARFNTQKSERSRMTKTVEPSKAEVASKPRSLVAA
ncbi:MAG TPA: amylo-alpha-1,6-glucosidase [Verrucomicrobiae bacterium]|nr:amylo-alpha-1,6-glucosidase [Verrucomicrobiae bacterium]